MAEYMDTIAEAIETAAKEIAELFGATADLLNELFQQIADLAYEILPSHLCSDNKIKPKAEPWKKSGWNQQHNQRYTILFVFGRRKRKQRRPNPGCAALIYHRSS